MMAKNTILSKAVPIVIAASLVTAITAGSAAIIRTNTNDVKIQSLKEEAADAREDTRNHLKYIRDDIKWIRDKLDK